MKKIAFVKCFSLIFFICVIMCGCAMGPQMTKIKGVWKYDQYSGGYLDRIMIVGKPRMDAARIEYEDYMIKMLKKRSVETIPSYTVIPDMKDLNRESVKQAADVAGVKAVLATKVVGVDEKEVVVSQSQKMDYVYTPNGVYMRPYLDGPKVVNFTKVRVETGLFELESEKLIWAATSAIMNPDSADEAIKDFSKAIIEQLTKDGYIRP
ncbi:MAG: hypothetical protein C4518_11170 [Desulfobacteraceae bacterium]|nr:MAG: hypothetical protein C4518_11170 [Desulfobacteraceae bacterium]